MDGRNSRAAEIVFVKRGCHGAEAWHHSVERGVDTEAAAQKAFEIVSRPLSLIVPRLRRRERLHHDERQYRDRNIACERIIETEATWKRSPIP